MMTYQLTFDYETTDSGIVTNQKVLVPEEVQTEQEARAKLETRLKDSIPTFKSLNVKKYERVFI
jgi:hypothetical protein